MRLDLRKLRVRQPELIPIHPRSPSEAMNHNALIMPMLLWVRALGAIQTPKRTVFLVGPKFTLPLTNELKLASLIFSSMRRL